MSRVGDSVTTAYAFDRDTEAVAALTQRQIARIRALYVEGDADTCWPWLGTKHRNGYGRFCPKHSKAILAHRLVWLLSGRPIVSGLVFDHTCRRRDCVNWNHLEQVTPRENSWRGEGFTPKLGSRTSCAHGHELSGANVYLRAGGSRRCLTCQREYDATRRAIQKEFRSVRA